MFDSFSSRRRAMEWMDAPDADPRLLRESLAFIRRVNVLFRYTRATLSHLERFSRDWKTGQTIRILDVATGSADIPRAILAWAARRGFDVRIVAADLHEATVQSAVAHGRPQNLKIIRADALDLPFADASFDYAITNMFLHHLDDDQALTALRNMSRVARQGIIAADLIRGPRAYAWIVLFTILSNPMVKHDARVSVRQAFTKNEILRISDRAGVGFASYYRHFGHRFVLAGQKQISF